MFAADRVSAWINFSTSNWLANRRSICVSGIVGRFNIDVCLTPRARRADDTRRRAYHVQAASRCTDLTVSVGMVDRKPRQLWTKSAACRHPDRSCYGVDQFPGRSALVDQISKFIVGDFIQLWAKRKCHAMREMCEPASLAFALAL